MPTELTWLFVCLKVCLVYSLYCFLSHLVFKANVEIGFVGFDNRFLIYYRLKRNSYFQMTKNEFDDPKGLRYNYERGDVLLRSIFWQGWYKVFNVSHLSGHFLFLCNDVTKMNLGYLICIMPSCKRAIKHLTLQCKVVFQLKVSVRMIKSQTNECNAYYAKHCFSTKYILTQWTKV